MTNATNHLRSISLLAGLAVASTAALAAGGSEVVVTLAPGESIECTCERWNAVVVASAPEHRLYVLDLGSAFTIQEASQLLLSDQSVLAAEGNEYKQFVHGNTQSFFVRLAPTNYHEQPALKRIGANPSGSGPDGAGTIVAVVDTGISACEVMSAAVLDGYNFVDNNSDCADIAVGNDSNQNGTIDDLAGHGTFVAGLVSLLAPHSSLLPVKVLDSDGIGSTFSLAAGIYYAADRGAQVINLSLSFDQESPVVTAAIAHATAQGALVVASAGNDGVSRPSYPAANDHVLAVAATDPLDHKATFSDYGSYIDLCAPGVNIVSTMPNGYYGIGDGTSFAAAWVSGAAAILHSADPVASADQLAKRLRGSAAKVSATVTEYPGQMGMGRLSISAALATKAKGTAQLDK